MRPIVMTPAHHVRSALAGVGVTLLLTACGSGAPDDDAGGTPPGGPPQGEEQTVSPSPSDVPGSGGAPARQAAADLAGRLDVGEDEVSVVAVEAVTWRDGSLGCAEKGTMYTQALVEGTRITLRVDGRTFEYHAGGQRAPFLCERPTQ